MKGWANLLLIGIGTIAVLRAVASDGLTDPVTKARVQGRAATIRLDSRYALNARMLSEKMNGRFRKVGKMSYRIKKALANRPDHSRAENMKKPVPQAGLFREAARDKALRRKVSPSADHKEDHRTGERWRVERR